jgi:hypothetical protein
MRAKTVNQFQKGPLTPKSMGVGMDANIDAFVKSIDGADFSIANSPGDVLGLCAAKNRINYVDYLLDGGMDVNIDDFIALRTSAFAENYEMAKHLIDRGANLVKAVEAAKRLGQNVTHSRLINLWSMLKNQRKLA